MRLASPIEYNGKTYTDFELQRAPAFVIANTKKVLDSTNNSYSAMKTFLSGCVSKIYNEEDEVTDSVGIKTLIGKLSSRSAEFIALQGSLSFADDDGVEGCYPCPRCGHKVIKEKKTLDGEDVDTRDFVSTLPYEVTSETRNTFELTEPVKIVNLSNNQVLMVIESITMTLPTLDQTIAAIDEYGRLDSIRLQFAQYARAITHINGIEVDNKWRAQWGVHLFEQILEVKKDLKRVSDWILSVGLQTKVTRTCPSCGKEWQAYLDVTNFFVSGLQ